MSYQYTYAYMGLIFLIIWLILYLWREDTRKQMISISFIFGFAGVGADILYTQDWWSPLTLTNTRIGFEAFIVGFCIAGIATVIYEDLFKKRIRKRKNVNKEKVFAKELKITLLMLFLFFGTFYFFNLNSFIATIITLSVPTLIIYLKRKDLIIDSIVSGFLMLFIAFIVYSLLELITPGWVEEFWHFTNVPNFIFLNMPLDDMIWYFLTGMLIGPLYEFWYETKLVENN
ncbi:MAG TPA: lycopene cyclase domain-containing protein [Candidatus Nanoarchaeia archaeon]|nr:lycopene cyclase domain-containing protein [Candidatus Nanoarchaeia archaeon]